VDWLKIKAKELKLYLSKLSGFGGSQSYFACIVVEVKNRHEKCLGRS
jgi:hypothetical protein